MNSAKQLEAVAARPEVTETGKSQMARGNRKNQERRQKRVGRGIRGYSQRRWKRDDECRCN